jgi:hypothetical protein
MNVNPFLYPVEIHLCDDCISNFHPFESSIEPVILSKECNPTIEKEVSLFSMNCFFTDEEFYVFYNVFYSCNDRVTAKTLLDFKYL